MRFIVRLKLFMFLLFLLCCTTGHTQLNDFSEGKLFSTEEVLEIRLSGNIHELMNDRDDDSQYHPITLSYAKEDNLVSIPIKVKTRGHFRLKQGNCAYPPLLLNFSKKKESPYPLFSGQDKVKLVTPCKKDKYVVQEYLVYKLYNLITPKSFNARLVKVVYEDTLKRKMTSPLFGILLEEEDQMAKRNNTVIIDKKSMRPEQTNSNDFLKMAVFEYLIGNTDWSVQYLQNIKLIASDSLHIPSTVPYDFDHAGIVRATYAKPAQELQLPSTLTRRYRGPCITDMAQFEKVFSLFNELKGKIYGVYTACPFLEESYVKATVKYLDEFYKTINNPKEAQIEFTYPCNKSGTGNVVIMGLDKD